MPITGISSIDPSSDTSPDNPRASLRQLFSSIQSGDLAAAQQAFGSLTQNGVPAPLQNTTIGNDLNAVGTALQSGDVSAAQKAIDQLKTDLLYMQQTRGHHHHHHHHHGGQNTTQTDPNSQTDPNDPTSLIGTTLSVKA